jgi:hypothetical protein
MKIFFIILIFFIVQYTSYAQENYYFNNLKQLQCLLNKKKSEVNLYILDSLNTHDSIYINNIEIKYNYVKYKITKKTYLRKIKKNVFNSNSYYTSKYSSTCSFYADHILQIKYYKQSFNLLFSNQCGKLILNSSENKDIYYNLKYSSLENIYSIFNMIKE